MSLLNNMLRDLDARRAAPGERKELPGDVQPLPGIGARRLSPLLSAVAVLLALAVAWWWFSSRAGTAPAAPPLPAMGTIAPLTPVAPTVPATQTVPPGSGATAAAKPMAATPKAVVPQAAKPAAPVPAPVAVAASAQPRGDTVAVANKTDKAATAHTAPGPAKVEKTPLVAAAQVQADAAYRRGQTLLAQGAAAEAEAAFNQALHLTPEHAGARQALFGLLVAQQRKDEARALLEDGIAILPGHISWAMNIARLQMEKNDAAGAWATLQRSLPGAQGNGEYRAFCGTVLQRLGRSQEAIPHFHAALAVNPAEGRWWLGLALVLESAGHPAEAREAFARAKAAGNLPPDLAAFAEQKSKP